ncbi:hypothetical protein B4096_1899 [Heyndrickxia coagulans]|nr:hypothetical protein B4096_1899 [Heyndrickxia coagulans]
MEELTGFDPDFVKYRNAYTAAMLIRRYWYYGKNKKSMGDTT